MGVLLGAIIYLTPTTSLNDTHGGLHGVHPPAFSTYDSMWFASYSNYTRVRCQSGRQPAQPKYCDSYRGSFSRGDERNFPDEFFWTWQQIRATEPREMNVSSVIILSLVTNESTTQIHTDTCYAIVSAWEMSIRASRQRK